MDPKHFDLDKLLKLLLRVQGLPALSVILNHETGNLHFRLDFEITQSEVEREGLYRGAPRLYGPFVSLADRRRLEDWPELKIPRLPSLPKVPDLNDPFRREYEGDFYATGIDPASPEGDRTAMFASLKRALEPAVPDPIEDDDEAELKAEIEPDDEEELKNNVERRD